jgi:hypothetical protein
MERQRSSHTTDINRLHGHAVNILHWLQNKKHGKTALLYDAITSHGRQKVLDRCRIFRWLTDRLVCIGQGGWTTLTKPRIARLTRETLEGGHDVGVLVFRLFLHQTAGLQVGSPSIKRGGATVLVQRKKREQQESVQIVARLLGRVPMCRWDIFRLGRCTSGCGISYAK